MHPFPPGMQGCCYPPGRHQTVLHVRVRLDELLNVLSVSVNIALGEHNGALQVCACACACANARGRGRTGLGCNTYLHSASVLQHCHRKSPGTRTHLGHTHPPRARAPTSGVVSRNTNRAPSGVSPNAPAITILPASACTSQRPACQGTVQAAECAVCRGPWIQTAPTTRAESAADP